MVAACKQQVAETVSYLHQLTGVFKDNSGLFIVTSLIIIAIIHISTTQVEQNMIQRTHFRCSQVFQCPISRIWTGKFKLALDLENLTVLTVSGLESMNICDIGFNI